MELSLCVHENATCVVRYMRIVVILMVLLLVFLQVCLDVIKADLLKVFEEFYRNGNIGVNINSTFISLVPKKNWSVRVKDYRPINLVTSLYKIITKVLSIHLSEVIGTLF